jgi:hypothetical protein
MAVTLSSVLTNTNTYLGDASTDRVSDAERYQAVTEATAWLLEELGNEHMVDTYDLDYLDTVNYYKVTTPLANLLVGADLRQGERDQVQSFARKSAREMAEEIGRESKDRAWGLDRHDNQAYLAITFPSKYQAQVLSSMNTITDGGTWTADTTGSDATNLTTDTNEFKHGAGSLNFDLDVSQSVGNYAVIYLPDASSRDLSQYEDLGSFLYEVYIPENLYTTSLTLTWGSDTGATPSTKANYWSATVTTDVNGNALADGWNTIKVDWANSTLTGTPDSSAVVYYEFRVTYGASQADDTDYRLDYFRLVQPETLTFHYISWKVGTDTNGTDITAFTATTDIPFYSGQYDQYRYAVAHKAASILYYSALRLPDQGAIELGQAQQALDRYRKNFESSKVREIKSFKILGVNLRRRNKINRRY